MKATIFVLLLVVCGAMSTSELDPALTCLVRGVVYPNGALTGDPCDRCRCIDGMDLCNRMACNKEIDPALTCLVRGVVYPNGALTGDPCDRCRCIDGMDRCNKMACNKETTGVRQGCLLSPSVFLLAVDWIMKTTTQDEKPIILTSE